jgi:LysM repeat protein
MGDTMRFTKILAGAAMFCLMGTALTGFGPLALGGTNAEPAYGMFVNGQEVGTVKFAARGLALYDEALGKIQAEFDNEVYIEGEVMFRQDQTGALAPDSEEEIFNGIRQSVDIKTDAYAIKINDKAACYVKTEEEAAQVVEAIKKPFADTVSVMENHQLENVAVQEDIRFDEEVVFYQQLVDKDRAVEIITVGEEGVKEYTVKSGDSLWTIARAFDMRVADIQAANPDLKGENLQIDQVLKISAPQSLVTVVTKEKFSYTEPIPFGKETKEDSSIYVGESKVAQEGKDGEKTIEVNITRENGKEIARDKISETVTKQPVPEIIAKGTKKRPAPTVSRSSRGSRTFTRPGDLTPLSRNGATLTPWSTVNTIFTRGSIAKVTHLDTGLTFYVYRHGGTNHADVEPLTAADTAVMKRIYGSWSWGRESIIVESEGRKFAASMNGMPHGQYTIRNKNFNGHFCIHFLNSRTHGTNRVDPEHQAALKRVVN